MDDPDPLVCPDCGVLLRDDATGLVCPACGHTIAYDGTNRPDGVDKHPGVHGG